MPNTRIIICPNKVLSGGRTGQPIKEWDPQSWRTTRLSEDRVFNVGTQDCRCTGNSQDGLGLLVWGRVCHPHQGEHLGSPHFFCKKLPVLLVTFSSVPDLYLPETGRSLPVVIIKKFSRDCQRTIPWSAKLPPFEKPGSSRHSDQHCVSAPRRAWKQSICPGRMGGSARGRGKGRWSAAGGWQQAAGGVG